MLGFRLVLRGLRRKSTGLTPRLPPQLKRPSEREIMEALLASYGDASSDSDSDTALSTKAVTESASIPNTRPDVVVLPPPPVSLLTPPNSTGIHRLSNSNQFCCFSLVSSRGNKVFYDLTMKVS